MSNIDKFPEIDYTHLHVFVLVSVILVLQKNINSFTASLHSPVATFTNMV